MEQSERTRHKEHACEILNFSDIQSESYKEQNVWHTDRQTDDGQSDAKVVLCFASPTQSLGLGKIHMPIIKSEHISFAEKLSMGARRHFSETPF